MANISMIKCPHCKKEYQNFLATQLKTELATEKDICEQLCDDIDAMRRRARKAEADLAAMEKDNQEFSEEVEHLRATNNKYALQAYDMATLKADLKLCKADIELRKDYESHLQSTTKPMYSYNSWKKQKGD